MLESKTFRMNMLNRDSVESMRGHEDTTGGKTQGIMIAVGGWSCDRDCAGSFLGDAFEQE